MRLLEDKDKVTIIDLIDDMSVKGRGRGRNYLLNHGLERFKIYTAEGHHIKKYKVELINPKSNETLF